MKASPRFLLVLSGLFFSISSAQIEFVGYMTSAEGPRFTLKESKEEKASGWLRLGDSYLGSKLVAHDPQRGILYVEKNGDRFGLPLKQDRVAHGDKSKSTKPKIGKISIQFAGDKRVPEQMVRDGMHIRSGDEFNEVVIDNAIRSLYRTGRFKQIEFKHEQPTPDTLNLVVIITPN
jgi:hypothetical protein